MHDNIRPVPLVLCAVGPKHCSPHERSASAAAAEVYRVASAAPISFLLAEQIVNSETTKPSLESNFFHPTK